MNVGEAIEAAGAIIDVELLQKGLEKDRTTVERMLRESVGSRTVDRLAAVEKILALQPGDLLRVSGYVSGDVTLEAALLSDVLLPDADAKHALLTLYRRLTGSAGERR